MPHTRSIPRVIRFDEYSVDLSAGHLFKRGIRLRLRDQSFAVLTELLEHAGEVVTREQLRSKLWPSDTFVDFDNNLNTAVGRLREALGDSVAHPRFIETLPKRGYRFIGIISEPELNSEGTGVRRVKLLVLPFANLSGDPSKEYLADGMTEEFITDLAALAPERLGVIARTTAMLYKGVQADVARIGRDLGVDHVIEGSVRSHEDRVVLTVQLIQVKDQTHLWARRYDTDSGGLPHTVRDVTLSIAAQIGIPSPPPTFPHGMYAGRGGSGKTANDPEAYHLYLQGRSHLSQQTPEGIMRAKQCFQDAVARDPGFALAHCSLAESYWGMGFWGIETPKEQFSIGVWSAMRALEIDDTLADAHILLGCFRKELDYNWPEVQREMRRALELNPWPPSSTMRVGLLSGLMPLGRIEEGIAGIERGLEMDPLSPLLRFWLAELLDMGRQFERGLREAMLVIEHSPASFLGYGVAGQICRDMHRYDEATAFLRKATELAGGPPLMLGWLGQALVNSGNVDEASAVLEKLHLIASKAYVPPTSFAWIHLALGEIDTAFTWLDRAVDARDTMIIPIKTYAFLDPLRDDPRFHVLLRKMNLEP
jgi:TolB-like protein/tetratricopeptide (TPR) repeat protein